MVHVLLVFFVLIIVILQMVVLPGGGAVYGRGILVDGRSSSGAHGSGHVGCELLVIVQVMVRMVVKVLS